MHRAFGRALFLLSASLLAGCTDPAPSAGATPDRVLPQQLLADVLTRVEVPLQATSAQLDFDVADVTVPGGLATVRFEFVRSHSSAASLSDSCRIERDGRAVRETRFSDAGSAELGPEPGRCTIGLYPADPGVYTAVYAVEGPAPPGTHELHLRAEAQLPQWSGAHPTEMGAG